MSWKERLRRRRKREDEGEIEGGRAGREDCENEGKGEHGRDGGREGLGGKAVRTREEGRKKRD